MMKAELNNNVLHLRNENEEEKKFLDKAGKEGLRNFGSGSVNAVSLPSLANLIQVHFEPMEMALLLYCIGKCEESLIETYGFERILNLRKKINLF